jgi:2-polyprenyl-3-methyl-5-hydroxy-6-metoxy-1,4-benzoquinol methylase
MENLSECPVCKNALFSEFLQSRDFFLSQEPFIIVSCDRCGFRFTNPRPSPEEIERYYKSEEYISHDTAGKGIFPRLYRVVRNYSIRRKYNLVKSMAGGKTLLDIGCGTGEFLSYCKRMGYETFGIEPSDKARAFANEKLNLNVRPESGLQECGNGTMDVITLWHVLEHVHDLNGRMRKIREIIKETGKVIIAVPNSGSPDAAYYKEFWAAYDLPRHLYHFTRSSLEELAQKNGFNVEMILPMKLDAFYISLLSEKYKTGKQNFIRAFFRGLSSNISAGNANENYSSTIFILKPSNWPK